jgi:hypothetical protein
VELAAHHAFAALLLDDARGGFDERGDEFDAGLFAGFGGGLRGLSDGDPGVHGVLLARRPV